MVLYRNCCLTSGFDGFWVLIRRWNLQHAKMHENAKNALGYTLLPIIMEVENGSLQYYFSFLSFGVIFYFHGRKGTYRYLLFRLISNASAPTTGLTGTGWKLHPDVRWYRPGKNTRKKRVSRKEVMVDIQVFKDIFLATLSLLTSQHFGSRKLCNGWIPPKNDRVWISSSTVETPFISMANFGYLCWISGVYMGDSKKSGTPKSSILIGFSIINYKPSILGYPYFWKHPYILGLTSYDWKAHRWDPMGILSARRPWGCHRPCKCHGDLDLNLTCCRWW